MKLKKILYWVLSFTWGLIPTLIGCFAALVLLCKKQKPTKYKNGYYYKIGTGWGGINLGPISIVNKYPSESILQHEYGHSLQNIYFGPLYVFLIAIPSVIRCKLIDNLEIDNVSNLITVISLILGAVSGILLALGILLSSIVLTYIGIVFIAYSLIISVWLIILYVRYHKSNKIEYNSIWFERQASKLGSK